MKKNYINKIIANDIVNNGINNPSSFNYIIYLDEYLKNMDFVSKEYIGNNLEDIKDEISLNKKIADFYFDEKEQSFDMVFYIDNVLDRVEKEVYRNAELMNKKIDINDVRNIANELMDDDAFNDDMIRKIEAIDGEYGL